METFTVEIDGFLADDIVAEDCVEAARKYCYSGQVYDELKNTRDIEEISVIEPSGEVTKLFAEVLGDSIQILEF